MDAAAEIGRNPVSTIFSLSMDITRLMRDGTATKFSGANGDREILIFYCSADHEQDWQPYPVHPCPCYCICDDHTYTATVVTAVCILFFVLFYFLFLGR